MENPDILTAQEVAAYLRMNTMTIYKMAQTGRIPASKIMDCWRFRRKEIDRWLQERHTGHNVLLIDTDREFTDDAHHRFEIAGVHCDVVTTTLTALETIKQNDYSLVLVGMDLGDGNGVFCLNRIEKEFPRLRVVLMVRATEWRKLKGKERETVAVEKMDHPEAWRKFIQLMLGKDEGKTNRYHAL